MIDDFFEGWLSMPSIENFFGGDFWETSKHQSHNSKVRQRHQAAAFRLTQLDMDKDNNTENQSQLSADAPVDSAAGSPIVRKRRVHTKSRLGCINCKRRKIKCQEQWPSCTNCIKRGCFCRYPTIFRHTQHDRIVSEVIGSPRPFVSLSDVPATYSANDMRLFHHFLVAAHPLSSHKDDSIWVRDVPAISHQYDYLMHSILALAGSHLSVIVDDPRGNMALLHRQKAIKGLGEAFTRWPPKAEEAHVMLACSYILGTQCIYLPDGNLDMFISLRGCAMISQMIQDSHMEGIFSLQPGLHYFGCELKREKFPALDQDLVHDALRSLAGFSHVLCRGREIERAFFAQLVESIHPLLVHSRRSSLQISANPDAADGRSEETIISSKTSLFSALSPIIHLLLPGELPASCNSLLPELHRATNALISGRTILCTWPQDDVTYLFSPTNKLGAVLILHAFAIGFVLSPLAIPNSALGVPIKGMIEWYERIVDSVDDDEQVRWNQYIKWPSHILTTIRCCSNEKRVFTGRDLHDILIKDPRAFRIAD